MENSRNFLSLLSDQQIKQIFENLRTFENLKREYESIPSDNEVDGFVLDIKYNWKLHFSHNFPYKPDDELMHELFVRFCLAPIQYQ